MKDITHTYPLQWPEGMPRTRHRKSARFQVTPGQAKDELMQEIRLLGGKYAVITSNLELGRSGQILARQNQIADPGVALYFEMGKDEYVLACDKYLNPFDNIRAIYLIIGALRAIERHGSPVLMKQAFAGFKALPAAEDTMPNQLWYQVLDLPKSASLQQIKDRYRQLSKRYHPDGSHPDAAKFRQVHAAYLESQKGGAR
jgi:hypothetical protein